MSATSNVVVPPVQIKPTAHSTRKIPLGRDTVNTCNPAVSDVDGDGFDEIALPLTEGEQDMVRLYDHTGELAWENRDVRFYHSFYGRNESYAGTHWHYRTAHRHLLTECVEFRRGAPVVVVGDGPLHFLDAKTGEIANTVDLGGHVQLWTAADLGASGEKTHIIACVDRDGEGVLACVEPSGATTWEKPMPGNVFTDAIRAGDITGDGRDDIGFSIESDRGRVVSLFQIYDSRGTLLWQKSVPDEIGEDSHVDDFQMGMFGPGGMRVVVTGTGASLFDERGNRLWGREDVFQHGQKVLPVRFLEDVPGHQFYFVASFERKVGLVDFRGKVLWEFADFSNAGKAIPDDGGCVRLTTAGGTIHWTNSKQILQSEVLSMGGKAEAPSGTVTLYLTILNADGTLEGRIPYTDNCASRGISGSMCAIPARMSRADRDDIVVVNHHNSTMLLIRNET